MPVKIIKRSAVLVLVALLLSCVGPYTQPVHASWLGDTLREYAQTYIIVKLYYEYAYNHWKPYFQGEYSRQFGKSKDPEANAILDRMMPRFVDQAKTRGEKIRVPYSWFVADQKEMNAFAGFSNVIGVFKGTFDLFNNNEDELAFVLAHEITHSQNQHLLKDLDKIIGYELAAKIFAARHNNKIWAQLVGYSAAKNLIAGTVTMKHELEADDGSFERAVALGYNPGGGAAAWTKVHNKYGDYHRNVFNVLFKPNDHPLTSARINAFAAKMTAYSNNRVTVNGSSVILDGKELLTCAKTATELARERAYIIAGNLAKACHDGQAAAPAAISEDGKISLGSQAIITPAPGEPDARTLAARLDEIRGLAGTAKPGG